MLNVDIIIENTFMNIPNEKSEACFEENFMNIVNVMVTILTHIEYWRLSEIIIFSQ